ncbi:hypothetical protein M408DRAFT_251348 [Serendipita vermifera MAFF 305830]|uniref:Uncharacterized protein n=1 Tax=Serendipita vermifera MAFF 305830 TaxID=933852 RepID=A0A0C2X2M4_SERVB|nr:hypothetical protein M408DRAFT_251348 [Serendipita vermifera MAFF 305830]
MTSEVLAHVCIRLDSKANRHDSIAWHLRTVCSVPLATCGSGVQYQVSVMVINTVLLSARNSIESDNSLREFRTTLSIGYRTHLDETHSHILAYPVDSCAEGGAGTSLSRLRVSAAAAASSVISWSSGAGRLGPAR